MICRNTITACMEIKMIFAIVVIYIESGDVQEEGRKEVP